jgi:hypothetical protein
MAVSNIEAPEDAELPEQPENLPAEAKKPRSRRALGSARRELNDKELLSPAIPKMLLDEIDRLEEEKTELAGFRSRFYDADKKVAVLEQRQKISLAQEIVSLACLTVGGAALGYAPSVWSSQPTGAIALGFGIVLVLGGIIAKALTK